jgi:hypothetical protein
MTLSTFLKRVLMFDAASCLAMGALLAGAAGALAPLFGIDQGLVRGAGLALLPTGAFILWLATRETVPALLVYLLIAANLLWVAESVALVGMTSGITAVGAAFVGIQAAAVAGLSLLEWIGIRRSSAVAA